MDQNAKSCCIAMVFGVVFFSFWLQNLIFFFSDVCPLGSSTSDASCHGNCSSGFVISYRRLRLVSDLKVLVSRFAIWRQPESKDFSAFSVSTYFLSFSGSFVNPPVPGTECGSEVVPFTASAYFPVAEEPPPPPPGMCIRDLLVFEFTGF